MEYVIGRLQELLRPFKSSENPNSAKFVAGDAEAISVLSTWPELPILLQEPLVFGGIPQHNPNRWKYVWKFRRIDYHELEKRTGIKDRKKLQEKVNLLIMHQLIYPDGSISQPARALLNPHPL